MVCELNLTHGVFYGSIQGQSVVGMRMEAPMERDRGGVNAVGMQV